MDQRLCRLERYGSWRLLLILGKIIEKMYSFRKHHEIRIPSLLMDLFQGKKSKIFQGWERSQRILCSWICQKRRIRQITFWHFDQQRNLWRIRSLKLYVWYDSNYQTFSHPKTYSIRSFQFIRMVQKWELG